MYLKNISIFYNMTPLGLKYYWITNPSAKKPMVDAFVRKCGAEALQRPKK